MEEHAIEIIGGVIALLIALVGWLLARSISQIDDTMKGLASDHRSLSTDLQEVKSGLQADTQLREFQDRRIEALEKEKRSLYNAFNAMDRLISRKWGESTPLADE